MTQKVISAAQLSLGISSHNNHYLFSDHYLNSILKNDSRWKAAVAGSDEFLAWLTNLYEKEKGQLADYSESQLEDNWFKPIFRRLGHVFEGQAAVPGLESGIKYPDFVFFPDEEARQSAVAAQWGLYIRREVGGACGPFEKSRAIKRPQTPEDRRAQCSFHRFRSRRLKRILSSRNIVFRA